MTPATERPRFGDVDGLRAVAAVAIVVYEATRFIASPATVPPVVARLLTDASQGYSLFVLISALVVAYPVIAAVRATGTASFDLGPFFAGRLVRIVPAYAVMLVATTVLQSRLSAGIDAGAVLRDALLVGDGNGNDGLRAVELLLRAYLIFPIVLTLWVRVPFLAVALAAAATAADALSIAHAWGIGIVVPLLLGIVAADIRAADPASARFGTLLAVAAALGAWFVEPLLSRLPGAYAAADAIRIDPLWSVAVFGLTVGVAASPRLARLTAGPPFRALGAFAYAVSLVAGGAVLVTLRWLPAAPTALLSALQTAAALVGGGVVMWLAVDRWFADDRFRQALAGPAGRRLDAVLAGARLARITMTRRPPRRPSETEEEPQRALPPAPAVDLAVLSTRSGSAQDLAADILATKRRLGDRAPALAAEPEPPPAVLVPEPAVEPASVALSPPPPMPPPPPEPPPLPPPVKRGTIRLRISPRRKSG